MRSKAGKDAPTPRPQHSAARENFMRKKASVRRTFYRSFCLLIVLPLVAVAAAGSALLYRKLLATHGKWCKCGRRRCLPRSHRTCGRLRCNWRISEDSEGFALRRAARVVNRRYETAARLEAFLIITA